MERYKSVSDGVRELITALYGGQGLQAIADWGGKLLGNPVTIVDASFKGLAVSEGFEAQDNQLRENLNMKFMDEASISALRGSGHINKINRGNAPVFSDPAAVAAHGFESKYGWLDSAIKIKGIVVGYFSAAYLFSPPEDGDELIADQLVKLAAIELRGSADFMDSHGVMYESLLTDLLSGELNQELIARYRMRSLGGSFGEELFVVAVGRPASERGTGVPVSAQETLRRLIGDCFSVRYDDCVVLLLNRSRGRGAAISDEEGMDYFLRQNDLLAGISNGFTDPTDMGSRFSQSRAAIDLGNLLSNKRILNYGNFVPEHIFRLLSAGNDLTAFCDPRLGELADRERDYRLELLETFYDYVTNMKDAAMTSAKLNIHKNTLFHRINTVMEEFDLKPGEGERVFDLLFGYRLLRYMRDFRPY